MSSNKMRYYKVQITSTVQANSQRDAVAIAFGEDLLGKILAQDVNAYRVLANELTN